jgi:hypothetical protein
MAGDGDDAVQQGLVGGLGLAEDPGVESLTG